MKKLFAFLVFLLASLQGAWGWVSVWEGSGTEADPYLINESTDWEHLMADVDIGRSYEGKVFRMTADIDTYGYTVGVSEEKPFRGTFDGDGHTLTFSSENNVAPFGYVSGATIRHLKTVGTIKSSRQYAAGIVSMVVGSTTTYISNCESSVTLYGHTVSNAAFGGLVGAVAKGGLNIHRCIFSGYLDSENSAGMVGWSNVPVSITYSIVSPSFTIRINGGRTFVRMAGGVEATLSNCFFTQYIEPSIGEAQGEGVFNEVILPEGYSYEIEGDPAVQIGGVDFWRSGTWIVINPKEGSAQGTGNGEGFSHWYTGQTGCYVSDPFTRYGRHQLLDVERTPELFVSATPIAPADEREMDGTKYRYLSARDYHLYMSDKERHEKGYYFDDSSDRYLVKTVDGSDAYITAVTGWVPGNIPSDGAQIHNDLVGVWHSHTLLGTIAPHAFDGCAELKSLYFKDTDANNYNELEPMKFSIGSYAFANCPNLKEVKLMQYTTKGDNHWEIIRVPQITSVGDSLFAGSPKAKVSCHAQVYQDYLSSKIWKDYWHRFVVYDATTADITLDGVKYHIYRDITETEQLTNKNKKEMVDQQIGWWNTEYKNFNAAELLDGTDESQNIYYTSVVGVEDSYLRGHDGKMIIYNDVGEYYNYKNICLTRDAIAGNPNVTSIEFKQTFSPDQTSRSDLKMVIQNGAFEGCTNLKELRMFYRVYIDGMNYLTLGPEDVIPGDNIFGGPVFDEENGLGNEETVESLINSVPKDFKILVASDRYNEFLNDPNWARYSCFIEPVELEVASKRDFDIDGLSYGYIRSLSGIAQTSQTVSQDISWWTVPRIAIEVIQTALTIKSLVTSIKLAKEASKKFARIAFLQRKYDSLMGTYKLYALNLTHDEDGLLLNAFLRSLSGRTDEELGLTYSLLNEFGQITGRNRYAGYAGELLSHGFGRMTNEGVFVFEMDAAKEYTLSQLRYAASSIMIYSGSAATRIKEYLIEPLMPAAIQAMNAATREGARVQLQALTNFTQHSVLGGIYSSGELGHYNSDALQKGMRSSLLSNIHQVGAVGGGFIITTPQKNLVYHTYIKSVGDNVTDAVIHAGTDQGQGSNANTRTMGIKDDAFRNKKNLQRVSFYENNVSTNEAIPMLLSLPDSAFVGCENLTEFSTLLKTKKNGTYALGPESFILAGDHVFEGLDPEKFHIVIDPKRKEDYLNNESWAPLEKYFVYQTATPDTPYSEYGVKYSYVYENGSVQKVHKEQGHKIEHMFAAGPDLGFINEHGGTMKLCNDIGSYNNYQLDAVGSGAFRGCNELRAVYFTDLFGSGAFGDSYTDLNMTLEDSCFVNCKNLADLDLLYMVTDGDNHIDPIKPSQLKIGKGVFEGTNARLKMMPQQVAWFEADSTWNVYRDRFMPCVIQVADEGVKDALGDMCYHDMAAEQNDVSYWSDYIDLARIGGVGFSWLDGRFTKEKDNLRSFPGFKYFESVGLDYVGNSWFKDCSKLSNIVLPSTIKRIGDYAFDGCALNDIEIPAGVEEIGTCAFRNCGVLKHILVRGENPAKINMASFPQNEGMKIYVPASKVSLYKNTWLEYAEYIVSDAEYKTNKVVTVKKAGTLADELGLYVEWSYSGLLAGDEPRYLHGNYAKYDSLTVKGPLNDLDLAVIRYLSGCDSYHNNYGKPTDGNLQYLNLYDASIVKDPDCKAFYLNAGWGLTVSLRSIKEDNCMPAYVFANCKSLKSVVLPKSLKSFEQGLFIGCSSLNQVACVGSLKIDEFLWSQTQLDYPLKELVLITDEAMTSNYGDPWGKDIGNVYTLKSQISQYMGEVELTRRAQYVLAPFDDDHVMKTLAERGELFPSTYVGRENVEGLFSGSNIERFNEFLYFKKVKHLDQTFMDCNNLQEITLPQSIESIAASAFAGCSVLDTIRVSSEKVPELALNAFESLPSDFRILVPKNLCKLYRTKWEQYADHIVLDEDDYADESLVTVTVTNPNMLAEALGFTKSVSSMDGLLNGVSGDYSHLKKLKVIGPISGVDLDLLKYLAGYCSWSQTRNLAGHLEYIDLYDAQIVESTYVQGEESALNFHKWAPFNFGDNELPRHAFLKAYSLKTLILPRTVKVVQTRAFQECEALETLVLGDDLEDFNWNSLDDDVSLTRMYILAKKKVDISTDFGPWRLLCNNYNPTFDAFYVRPSLYRTYLSDNDYVGSSWQRTNNISKGMFEDDESFCAFASHAAATIDDLSGVSSVDGWFDSHTGVKDLSMLGYTSVDSLSIATFRPLTQLEQVSLPYTLTAMEPGIFAANTNLRSVDFLQCDSTDIISKLHNDGLERYGINNNTTLVYVPETYGECDGVNIVSSAGGTLHTQLYRMPGDKDYVVPYSFMTDAVQNTRSFSGGRVAGAPRTPFTTCLPYYLQVPSGLRAYQLTGRDGNTLIFTHVDSPRMEAKTPYLLRFEEQSVYSGGSTLLNTDLRQEIPASRGLQAASSEVLGLRLDGTFASMSNEEASTRGISVLQGDGNWHPVSTTVVENNTPQVKPFTAYLQAGGYLGTFSIDFNENEGIATDIDSMKTVDADGTEHYYDLNGRELQGKPKKGVVIKRTADGRKNGRKYVTK